MIPPKPIKIEVLEEYKLKVIFDNNEERIYDMKKNLEKAFYKKLNDSNYFKTVKISGITLEWKDGEDIDPNELYSNSILIKKA